LEVVDLFAADGFLDPATEPAAAGLSSGELRGDAVVEVLLEQVLEVLEFWCGVVIVLRLESGVSAGQMLPVVVSMNLDDLPRCFMYEC